MHQLQRVDRELEVDQPACSQLDVERPGRRFVGRHVGAHLRGVGADLGRIALHPEHPRDGCGELRAPALGAIQRPRTKQRHVLPSPGFVALIGSERVEPNGEHPLLALRSQAGIDVVQRPRRGRDRQRRDHALRQPVEIIGRAERFFAVRHRLVGGIEQEYQVEIAGVGQRHSAQSSQTEDHQFAARHPPVRGLIFMARGIGQSDDRPLGDRSIAHGEIERIAVARDQLHPQCKAPLADHPPHPVEPFVVAQALAAFGQPDRHRRRVGRFGKARCVDQPVEQSRPPRQLVGQGGGVDQYLAQHPGQPRLGLEQAIQIDPARQPLDDVAEAVERMAGIRAVGDRTQQDRKHRLERRARCRRTKRAHLPRAPAADQSSHLSDIGKAHYGELVGQQIGIVRQMRTAVGGQAVEPAADEIDMGAQRLDQRLAALQPVKRRNPVQRIGHERQAMRLLVIDHLDAMLDRAQAAIGLSQCVGDIAFHPARRDQRRKRIEHRALTQRRVSPTVDQLLHLGIEFDLADPAAPALQIIAGGERRALRIMVADAGADVADLVDRAEI